MSRGQADTGVDRPGRQCVDSQRLDPFRQCALLPVSSTASAVESSGSSPACKRSRVRPARIPLVSGAIGMVKSADWLSSENAFGILARADHRTSRPGPGSSGNRVSRVTVTLRISRKVRKIAGDRTGASRPPRLPTTWAREASQSTAGDPFVHQNFNDCPESMAVCLAQLFPCSTSKKARAVHAVGADAPIINRFKASCTHPATRCGSRARFATPSGCTQSTSPTWTRSKENPRIREPITELLSLDITLWLDIGIRDVDSLAPLLGAGRPRLRSWSVSKRCLDQRNSKRS